MRHSLVIRLTSSGVTVVVVVAAATAARTVDAGVVGRREDHFPLRRIVGIVTPISVLCSHPDKVKAVSPPTYPTQRHAGDDDAGGGQQHIFIHQLGRKS